MPANLTPDYMNAEKAFKAAKTDPERLECLQEMLATIPKHKGTDKMQADIKRRISKLKQKMEQQGKSRKGISYTVKTEGAGQVAVVGPPNSGKSLIVKRLTGAHPEVAPYPFTTREPYPAMMPYLDIRVQLVDLPPVSIEHTDPWVFDLIKSADALLIVLSTAETDPVMQYNEVRELIGKRNVFLEEPDSPDDLPRGAVVQKNLIALTHSEGDADGALAGLFRELSGVTTETLPVSLDDDNHLEILRKKLYELLGVIRVYSKPPGREVDEGEPFTVPIGSTLMEFSSKVHKDFATNLRFARCWGSAKFDGQTIPHDHILQDGDIVELHI